MAVQHQTNFSLFLACAGKSLECVSQYQGRISQCEERFNLYRKIAKPALLTILLVSWAFQANADMSEDQLREAVNRDYPGAVIQETESSDGFYEVDFTYDGESWEATYDQEARLIAVENENFSTDTLYLGLYVSNESAIYEGTERETDVYPYILYDNGDFYVQGKSLGYRIYKGDFRVAAQMDIDIGEGYDPEDSDYLSDMDELDLPVSLGVVIEKELSLAEIEFSVLADVAGAHKGVTASFGIGHEFDLTDDWTLEIGVESTWHDASYNDYYFGVAEKFARADRPAYEADAGVDVGLEVELRGRLWGNWYMLSELEYLSFSSEMKDSPLTSKDNQTSIAIGIGYAF